MMKGINMDSKSIAEFAELDKRAEPDDRSKDTSMLDTAEKTSALIICHLLMISWIFSNHGSDGNMEILSSSRPSRVALCER